MLNPRPVKATVSGGDMADDVDCKLYLHRALGVDSNQVVEACVVDRAYNSCAVGLSSFAVHISPKRY